MKNLKEVFEATLNLDEQNSYKVGDRIMYVLDDVAKANPNKDVDDDSGYIVKIVGKDYIVKSDLNGQEFKVANKSVISYGGSGEDGQT